MRTPPAPALKIAGYAAIFGRPDMGGDIVLRGAFATDANANAPGALAFLLQHDVQHRIGTVTHLEEDGYGLRVVAGVTDTRAVALIRARAITGLSFGYRVRSAHGHAPRRLIDLALTEISLVTHPMQPLARLLAFSR